MRQNITTSVIGSYPVPLNTTEMINEYFLGNLPSWYPYITQAVREMVSAGICLVSDGQTRDPFIQLFTRHLSGCRVRQRTEIIGPVEFTHPITLHDQIHAKKRLPRNVHLIGVLTGPYTLTKSSIDSFYHDEKQLCFDFATALRHEAELLQNYVELISIDEPFFSNELPEYAKELLNTITAGLSCPTRLHVCGDVSKIISQLVDMPVDILSHEFKASPFLFEAFQQYPCKKQMCIGAVRSDDLRVEPVEEIIAHVQKAADVFGEHILQIAPDCGQRLLPPEIAFRKLQHLTIAGGQINGG
jgi:5-methyltetrahydropteroyltriglutamate--homocysteine methyltransferase